MMTQSSKVLFIVDSLAYQHALVSYSCGKIKNYLPKKERAFNTVYRVYSIQLELVRMVNILKSFLVIYATSTESKEDNIE